MAARWGKADRTTKTRTDSGGGSGGGGNSRWRPGNNGGVWNTPDGAWWYAVFGVEIVEPRDALRAAGVDW